MICLLNTYHCSHFVSCHVYYVFIPPSHTKETKDFSDSNQGKAPLVFRLDKIVDTLHYEYPFEIKNLIDNSMFFRKSLRISSAGKKDTTSGEIVNLMSVDAQRICDLVPYVNMLWSSPLQIVVAIYMLYQILGPSVFAGLLVMIVLVPVNGVIAGITR